MKYNFLFMEYVNLTKIINNIRKTETKRGEQKILLENMKEEIKKKKNPTARSEPLMSPLKNTTPITARPHHTL